MEHSAPQAIFLQRVPWEGGKNSNFKGEKVDKYHLTAGDRGEYQQQEVILIVRTLDIM